MAHLAPMCNGVGRYISQLKRLTFHYCKWGGSSKGIREYIDSEVIHLAKENPQVSFYVRHRPYRHPRLVAEFLNGNSRIVSTKNLCVQDIQRHIKLLLSSSGIKPQKLKKMWYTDNPSIQGNWNPFLHKQSRYPGKATIAPPR